MATPKRKTILDYFSQAGIPEENPTQEGCGGDDCLQGSDVSIGPETPKRSKRSSPKVAVEGPSTDSVEQINESCIFSSCSADEQGMGLPAEAPASKRLSVCSGMKRCNIQEGSTRMSAIIADFLDVEAGEPDISDASSRDREERYEFLVDVRDRNMKRKGEEGYDPSTLYIPPKYYQRFTSFEKQFWDIKRNHYDTIIFFKKGKFYELYENDAEIASSLFDLRIVERVNMKMAGFPESSYDAWAAKFLSHGYKIGKVEQVENSIGKKLREQDGKKDKIISRELREVVTQGTIYNGEFIHSSLPFYLAVVVQDDTCYADRCLGPLHFSLILYDASVNSIFSRSFCDSSDMSELKSIFVQNDVREVITDMDVCLPGDAAMIRPVKSAIVSQRKYDFKNDREFLCFTYLHNYMKGLCRESSLASASISEMHGDASLMSLDGSTLLNMDILANNFDGTDESTLFRAINYCSTPFGQRLLRKWLVSPLTSAEKILERRSSAEVFSSGSLDGLISGLKELGDLERHFGKLSNTNPVLKDISVFVLGLRRSMSLLRFLATFLENRGCGGSHARSYLNMADSVLASFDRAYKIDEGEIVPADENDELFALGRDLDLSHRQLDTFLQELKESTGIPGLSYKSVGKEIFQIEAPKDASMPPGFFAVSSTKTHKRFYSKELKDMVGHLIETEERIFQSRGSVIRRAVELLKQHTLSINQIISYLASIDCLISFARFNRINKTTMPELSGSLEMVGFTNPVYPDYIRNTFKPANRITLITGPNMGGKSTYLRSICLNIILAQMGMGVLCERMSMPIFDKIFTRIGASDSLAKGESTFMVELSETSKILNHSTSRSFVIMDELGRGTSTRDGEAIAEAVLDYVKGLGCYMLFSTHYHKLVERYEGVDKSHVRCKLDRGDITFLYKVENGICHDSHGLHVAKLAGIPEGIVARSFEIRELLLRKETGH